MAEENLFDEHFMRRLEMLTLAIRRAATDSQQGQRSGASRGGLIEFRDYRKYAVGDDPRYIDWNLFSRLGKLFVKEFDKDVNVSVAVLVDGSGSMLYGQPSKQIFVLRLAAALAYLTLASGDRVTIKVASETAQTLDFISGKNAVFPLMDFLKRAHFGGSAGLKEPMRELQNKISGGGLIFVLSDFYESADLLKEVKLLRARGKEVTLLHVLSPQELEPEGYSGGARLIDMENREILSMPLSSEALAVYQAEWNSVKDHIRGDCAAHGAVYLEISTAEALEDVVLGSFRKSGLIR